jgi:type I restriction enzyme R subunit
MQALKELIQLAKDLDTATKRGEDLGLTDDGVAFYEALAASQSAQSMHTDERINNWLYQVKPLLLEKVGAAD